VIIALCLILNEIPELSNMDLFLQPVSHLFSLFQFAQELLPGALDIDGRSRNEDGSLGREIHLSIGGGQEVQTTPVVLKAEADDKVSMIYVFDNLSLIHT
jgi:hypothetical protein